MTVSPVLFCAPVFWLREYWSTHDWDWVQPRLPLAEKPSAEFEVSLDVTLRDLFAAAYEAWGLEYGPDGLRMMESARNQGAPPEQLGPVSEIQRFAFVRADADADGIDPQVGYGWPSRLPIARADGTIEEVQGHDVTIRELLVSSQLGLVEGDVTRPYVHPVLPQGDVGQLVEVARATAEAIHATYHLLPQPGDVAEHIVRLIRVSEPPAREALHDTNEVIDYGGRAAFLFGLYKSARRWWSRRDRRGPPEP